MITAAALCPAPPLLARELTGADPVVPELRQACRDAAAALLRGRPDVVAVVGAGDQTRTWDEGLELDVSGFAPGIGAAARDGSAGLPLPLGLGARLLDQAGYAGCVSIELEDARYWGALEKEQAGIAKAYQHLARHFS